MRSITVYPGLLDEIRAHARTVYPMEACGLLVGRDATATRFVPTPNILSSPTAYEIDPAALASTFRSLRESGEQLIAIMHSHPAGPAHPSQQDLERAYYPDVIHIIVSLADPEKPQIRAFRIIDAQGYEVEVHAIL